jgi:hypothetical protein
MGGETSVTEHRANSDASSVAAFCFLIGVLFFVLFVTGWALRDMSLDFDQREKQCNGRGGALIRGAGGSWVCIKELQ